MTSPSITKRRASRLAFVQYLYQQKLGGAPVGAESYLEEILEREPEMAVDKAFLKKLLKGFADERAHLQHILEQQMAKGRAFNRVSPLIQSLLEAAAYELVFYPEVKTKILLDEYVSLAAEFFDDPELGFVGGTLQELANGIR